MRKEGLVLFDKDSITILGQKRDNWWIIWF